MLSARDSIASITRLTFFYDFFFDKISFFWGVFCKNSQKFVKESNLYKRAQENESMLNLVFAWRDPMTVSRSVFKWM